MKQPSRGRSDGFILVAVLVVLGLLAGLCTAATMLARASVVTALVDDDRLVADALVRAGLDLAAYQLLVLNRPANVVQAQQIRLDAGVVTLFVTSEGGKIDLNGSPRLLLMGLATAAGLKTLSPQAFADRIMARRRLAVGAAEDDPAALDAIPRKDDAFRSLDDLALLGIVSSSDVAALRPLATVYNPDGKIGLRDASAAVLGALPGFDSATVDRILALRSRREKAEDQDFSVLAQAQQEFVRTSTGPAYRVTIEATPNNGRLRRAEAVVTNEPSGSAPYVTLEWSEGSPS